VRRRAVDLLVLNWTLLGQSTSDGISKSSRLQTLSAEARVPVTRHLLLGAGWSWGERLTTYDRLPTVHLTGTSWRLFAGWAIPETRARQDRRRISASSAAADPWTLGHWRCGRLPSPASRRRR
jgi:hypothetical protein